MSKQNGSSAKAPVHAVSQALAGAAGRGSPREGQMGGIVDDRDHRSRGDVLSGHGPADHTEWLSPCG